MIDKNLFKEVVRVGTGVYILTALMILGFLIAGFFSYQVVFGGLLGATVCILNFYYLAYCVSKAMDKTDGKEAKNYVSVSYFIRIIIVAATLIVAIKLPGYFNYIAAAIPFVFPRIIITVLNIFKKGGNDA